MKHYCEYLPRVNLLHIIESNSEHYIAVEAISAIEHADSYESDDGEVTFSILLIGGTELVFNDVTLLEVLEEWSKARQRS